jgi:predicted aspartyl protease
VWVDVTAPGSHKSLHFLLDSGASVSVINLQTAKRLGLALGKRVSVQGVGADAVGFWPQNWQATAGEVLLPSQCLAVDLSALSGSCECDVDGLIGMDFFRRRIVQIDYVADKIRLLTAAPEVGNGDSLPLVVKRSSMRVPAKVNGRAPQWVRLDTGCASGLQLVADSAGVEGQETRVAVALSKVSVETTRSRVQLGTECFGDVGTDIHRKPLFAGEAGLLGNGLLSRFGSVTVDGKTRRLILERRCIDN